MRHFELVVLDPPFRKGTQRVLENVRSCPSDVSVKVRIPVEVLHAKLEQLSVFFIELLPKLLDMLVGKHPLSAAEIADNVRKLVDLLVPLDQPKKSRDQRFGPPVDQLLHRLFAQTDRYEVHDVRWDRVQEENCDQVMHPRGTQREEVRPDQVRTGYLRGVLLGQLGVHV